ncbi:MAG: phosphoadenylyl-sulfate reductase [Phycisphaeraceae bacterium]
MTVFSMQREPAIELGRNGSGYSSDAGGGDLSSETDAEPATDAAAEAEATVDLDAANDELAQASAAQAIRWAHDRFGDRLVMTSSFGAQSAALLHLANSVVPGIPVILIDTGYLFPETYAFALDLKLRLKLNLKVFAPRITPAFLEQAHGKLWERGEEGLDKYHQIMKIEPLQRALTQLGARGWLAGLRAGQTDHRATLPRVTEQYGITKVHPILNWSGKDVHDYLVAHDLPYHPLVKQGYLSIGDTHSTRPVTGEDDERAGRFDGLKQECGIHLPSSKAEEASWESSGL